MATQKKSPFQPKNLTPAQIQLESGGRQLDSSGKPLLGRYRDGTAPKQSERAYGAGQIQIATARATARKHGVPWDESKLLNDKDYNLSLADLHKGDLLKYYKGDKALAIAAYHSGTGNVDRSLRNHGRANFIEGLGPEGRNYVRKLAGEGRGYDSRGSGASGGRPVVRNKLLDQGKEVTMSEASMNPIVNPFKVKDQMIDRAVAVEEDLATTEAMLQQHGEKLNFVQEAVRNRTENAVNEKRVLLDEVQKENRALVEAVNPFLKKKQGIDTRLLELATMNPLEKGLRGIFDLNYNEKYLQKVSKNVASALDSTIANHSAQLSLTDEYLKSIDMEVGNESQLDKLTLDEMDQDAALMAQSLNASKMAFGFLGETVNANENLIRAQVLATSNYLDGQDLESINGLLGEALKSEDGTVSRAGVVMRVGELKERAMNWEKANLSLESSQMAIEAGRLDIASKHAVDWAGNASEGELRSAAASNGNYKGMQIPMDVVLGELANREKFNNYTVEKAMGVNALGNLGTAMQQTAQQLQTLVETSGRIGARSTNDQQINSISLRMKQLAQTSSELIRSGRGEEAAGPLMQEYQKLSAELLAITKTRATRLAGGNEKAAGMLEVYMTGGQLSRTEAIDGMAQFVAEGGLPAALRASPTFRAAYAATESATKLVEAQEAKIGKPFNKEAKAQRIRELAGPLLAKKVNSENMKQIHGAVPTLAKADGHPAGKIQQKTWQSAIQFADAGAYDAIGKDYDVSGAVVKQILNGTWNGAGYEKEQREELIKGIQSEKQSGRIAQTNNALLLRYLDESPDAKNGFKPSEALVDYMTSPKFAEKAARYESAQASYGFADFVAANSGDKGLVPLATGYASRLSADAQRMAVSDQSSSVATRNAYKYQPITRTKAILGAIPGLQLPEEQLLLGEIKKQFPKAGQGNNSPEVNTAIRAFIVAGKFQNPELERVRKIASKDWDTSGEMLDRAIDRATGTEDTMVMTGPMIMPSLMSQ